MKRGAGTPLRLAALFWLAAASSSLVMWRHHAALTGSCAAQRRLLAALQPEVERLERYESVAAALRGAPPLPADAPAPPAGWSLAPERRELTRLPAAGGWRGVRAELAWSRLPAVEAFALLSNVVTGRPPWRVANLRLEALSTPGQVRLEMTLETAEAIADR
jgi:hypothetical protein